MSSLKERIELLENDLKAIPSRISVYHDLPFAILRYDPTDDRLGHTRLSNLDAQELSSDGARSLNAVNPSAVEKVEASSLSSQPVMIATSLL